MIHRSYYLELNSIDDFRPKRFENEKVSVIRAKADQIDRCRFLWTEVGKGFWTEREDWDADQWIKHLGDHAVSYFIATAGGEDIGFFELLSADEEVKIEGIGLLSSWRGKGLGGGLLSIATEKAFAERPNRIWLHTATDDHPNALPNYRKRGYRVYHDEELQNPMPTSRGR